MLENSGLVLGVDSSLGLLTRLHNPRHVGVALLVHGRLLHLTHTGTEKEEEAVGKNSQIIFQRPACSQFFENTAHYCLDFLYFFRMQTAVSVEN